MSCRAVRCNAVSCRVVRTSSSRLEPCSVVGMSKVQTTHRHTHKKVPLTPSLPPADRIRTSVRTTLIHGIFYSPPSVLPFFRPPACRTRVESHEILRTAISRSSVLKDVGKRAKATLATPALGPLDPWGINSGDYLYLSSLSLTGYSATGRYIPHHPSR